MNPATLTLPDVLTELDLFAPMPDPSFLLSEPLHPESISSGHDLLRTDSSLALNSIEQPRNDPQESQRLEDDDLDLDLGEDPIDPRSERSIEIPRRATTPRAFEEGISDENLKIYDDDLQIDVGEDPISNVASDRGRNSRDELGDITMGDIDVPDIQAPEEVSEIHKPFTPRRREGSAQSSSSTLSSLRSSMERDLKQSTDHAQESSLRHTRDETEIVRYRQKSKKRKVLLTDSDTMIQQSQIKAQQNDRSKIVKSASFLSRDPALLALMTMQKNGSFVSNILGNGRSLGWAPELRSVLSVEVIRDSGDLKRKRDSAITGSIDGAATAGNRASSAQDQIGMGNSNHNAGRSSLDGSGDVEERLSADGYQPFADDDFHNPDDVRPFPSEDEQPGVTEACNDLNMPLLQSGGSIALGTKHAVHLFREHFSSSPKRPASRYQKPEILFQELLPAKRTSRADATKIFFEVLVLATKDTITVDQATDTLGGPIIVKEKKGLWGDWAETQTEGQIRSNGIVAGKA